MEYPTANELVDDLSDLLGADVLVTNGALDPYRSGGAPTSSSTTTTSRNASCPPSFRWPTQQAPRWR